MPVSPLCVALDADYPRDFRDRFVQARPLNLLLDDLLCHPSPRLVCLVVVAVSPIHAKLSGEASNNGGSMATIKQKLNASATHTGGCNDARNSRARSGLTQAKRRRLVIAFGHLRDAGRKAFLGSPSWSVSRRKELRKAICSDRLSEALRKTPLRIAVLGQITGR